jgi:hypothetical protein
MKKPVLILAAVLVAGTALSSRVIAQQPPATQPVPA